ESCSTAAVFGSAAVCRTRAWLLLRIARRLSMLLLPAVYFSKAPAFENAPVSLLQFEQLRQQLQSARQGQ
ncbi:MAG: hypothetical protein ACKPJD_33775, partial [Planctomycetaceae bacterium]